jgi:two-component system response regulator
MEDSTNDTGPNAGRPGQQRQQRQPRDARVPLGEREARNGTLLVVEDNADDVELMLRALKRNGITNPVVALRDGVQALDYLHSRGEYKDRPVERPEVVLLDLKLPRVGGLEVLADMKADRDLKVLPVVVLTSSVDERDVRQAYELGANSYLCKPGDFAGLLRVMGVLSTYWLEMVVPPPDTLTPA